VNDAVNPKVLVRGRQFADEFTCQLARALRAFAP
jgi:hypothetical protein